MFSELSAKTSAGRQTQEILNRNKKWTYLLEICYLEPSWLWKKLDEKNGSEVLYQAVHEKQQYQREQNAIFSFKYLGSTEGSGNGSGFSKKR